MTSYHFDLLQSPWWQRVRTTQGWAARSGDPLILSRSIGPVRFAYAPHAFAGDPSTTPESTNGLVQRLRAGAEAAELRHAHLVRWDIPFETSVVPLQHLEAAGLRKAAVSVQPPDTVVIDLSQGADHCLGLMKPKWRYNIRLAGKKGVAIRAFSGSDALDALDGWYDLYETTAQRNRIAIHSRAYYRHVVGTAVAMQEEGSTSPDLRVYVAEHQGQSIGGIIVASWRGMTTYLYGASADHSRNLMPNYALQWAAMSDAIEREDQAYDMFGIPPSEDPSHPMHGLYRFKTGFGGAIVHRHGCWDLDISPLVASAFRAAERLRSRYHHQLRKRGSR